MAAPAEVEAARAALAAGDPNRASALLAPPVGQGGDGAPEASLLIARILSLAGAARKDWQAGSLSL